MGSIVLLFPGQGSQKVGMAKDLVDSFPAAKQVFEEIDDALGFSLSKVCFEGPSEELTKTRIAQPALFAHGAAAWAVVKETIGSEVVAAAGHSLGEFTAYHAAGSFNAAAGAKLVRARGEVMFEVGTQREGTMAAILGDPNPSIEEICKTASEEAGLVVPANFNSDGQTVISGEVSGVERAMQMAKDAGAKRAIRLQVSGAFHSPLMVPAEAGLKTAIDATPFTSPNYPVFSNVTTQAVDSVESAKDLLVHQLTSPVRWSELVKNMVAQFPDALFVELGPGNVLSGLVSRIAPGTKTATCGTAADIEKLFSTVTA